MTKILIFFLLLLNLILLYLLNKKKIKNFFYKSKIQLVELDRVDEIFLNNKIDNNLHGPKQEVIVKNFCIQRNNNIVGITSDYEAWIISSLSKISNNILEFGTCSGKTTYLMALNSPDQAKITTLTLSPQDLKGIKKNKFDNKVSYRNLINESIYNKFLFSSTKYENKIDVIFQNSLNLNEKLFLKKFDLIFIDGGHTYSIVKSDSEKSFKMLKSNGIILWHDFVPGKESAKNVVKYINTISKEKKIFHINNTSLCYYRKK